MIKSPCEQWLSNVLTGEKWEQRGGQDKVANPSGVNRQGSKPVASYWALLEKEIRAKDAILYGRKV